MEVVKNNVSNQLMLLTIENKKNVSEVAKFFFVDILKFFYTMDDKIK